MRRVVIAVATAALIGGATPSVAEAGDIPVSEAQCTGDRYLATATDADDAAALMRGELTLPFFGTWQLPADPNWTENPFQNDMWAYDYHKLRWLDVLRREGLRTQNQAMLDRYAALWQDWIADNGYAAQRRSEFSWAAMGVGIRAIGLVCADAALGGPDWVRAAMRTHAAALLDPAQRGNGNHALHQDIGLLALGCRLGETSWRDTAVARSSAGLTKLVDADGVSTEGSMQYHALVYRWYQTLLARMTACGIVPDLAVFARVALMPTFAGYATQPDGNVVAWGDTPAVREATDVPGTLIDYVVSQGARGSAPAKTFALFRPTGYAFSRSGWFDTETAAQQSLASIRSGRRPPP